MSKDALHQLIHSLSSFEKGYYIKSKGDSHLTTLFKAMNKLEAYDKAGLEKQLKKHPEILKHLAKYKTTAYSDIMRVMRSYRQDKESSIDIRLRVYLADINFLIERGLYGHAIKLVRNAKELATKYEKYKTLLELLECEIDLAQNLYRNDHIETVRALIEEKKKIISMLDDEARYKELSTLIFHMYTRNPGNIRNNQSQLDYLNELMSDDLLTGKAPTTSFMSQRYYHQIHAFYYMCLDDSRTEYKHLKKNIECWETYPHMKDAKFTPYIKNINNYMHGSSRFEEHTVFKDLIDKLKKQVKPKNPNQEAIVFNTLNYLELFHYHRKADFAKLDEIVSDIQPLLKEYAKAIPEQRMSTFKILIGVFLFTANRYEEAYEKFDDIIKQKLSVRIDHQCAAWLFKLIIAYERAYDNFDNLYRSAQRFFNKNLQKGTAEIYLLFMKFLYQVVRSPLSETKGVFIQYQPIIKKLYNEVNAPGFGEILTWMTYMMTGKSMVEIRKKTVADSASVT